MKAIVDAVRSASSALQFDRRALHDCASASIFPFHELAMRKGGQNHDTLARDVVGLEGMIYRIERTAGYLLAAVWGWVGGMWLNQLIQECARRGC